MEQKNFSVVDPLRVHSHRRQLGGSVQFVGLLARLLSRLLPVLPLGPSYDHVRTFGSEENLPAILLSQVEPVRPFDHLLYVAGRRVHGVGVPNVGAGPVVGQLEIALLLWTLSLHCLLCYCLSIPYSQNDKDGMNLIDLQISLRFVG